MTRKLISTLCFLIVIAFVFFAFIYREQLEQFKIGGYVGVLIACFASTATILLPAPGILVVIEYSQFLNPVLVILLGGFGASLGETLGYALGRTGREISNMNTNTKMFNLFKKIPYFAIFLFSLLPLPLFDIIGIVSGMTKLNFFKFFVFCVVGKIIKMSIYVVIFTYARNVISI